MVGAFMSKKQVYGEMCEGSKYHAYHACIIMDTVAHT